MKTNNVDVHAARLRASFMRLTLRNLILSLSELEQSTTNQHGDTAGSTAWQYEELLNALRNTVNQLAMKKQSFNSKNLEALQQDLTRLVARN